MLQLQSTVGIGALLVLLLAVSGCQSAARPDGSNPQPGMSAGVEPDLEGTVAGASSSGTAPAAAASSTLPASGGSVGDTAGEEAAETSPTALPAIPSNTQSVATPRATQSDAGDAAAPSGAATPDGADSGAPEGTVSRDASVEAVPGDAGGEVGVSPRLVVATFNIRYDDRSTFGDNAWAHPDNPRRDRVVELVELMSPDLLGVQEALQNQVNDLREAFGGYGFVGVGRDDGENAGEFAGVFFRESRFQLLDSGHFWLSETPEVPGTVFPGSGSVRMATWVLLLDVQSSRELLLLNTHWDNVSQTSREASGALIRERLEVLGQERAVLLTGDLNQAEDNPAVLSLTGRQGDTAAPLVDGYRSVHPQESPDEATYHDFSGSTAGRRIDYVLHSEHFHPDAAEIRRDAFDGLYPSDHFPVLLELSW